MPRRRNYIETMKPADAESVIRAGLRFRDALLDGKQDLKPFNAQYRVLDDAMESVTRTLEVVAGRTMNPRAPDLGLLTAVSAAKPWETS